MSPPQSDYPVIAGTDISRCVLDQFRVAIAVQLSHSLGISLSACYEGIDVGKKGVDFTVAVPRFRLKSKPQELAARAAKEFIPNEYISSVEAAGIFLHFQVKTSTLSRLVLSQIYELSQPSPNAPHGTYGQNLEASGKKVVIEFSSPNIAKPFHAGHLRSTIIGTFLANVYETCGAHVIRMNYLGDWGKQFGLLAVGFERYGSEEKLSENAIMHLFDVYVRVNQDVKAEAASGEQAPTDEKAKDVFRAMEDGDANTLALWKRFRDLSIKAYEQAYRRLNVHFDVYAGESLVTSENIQDAIKALRAKDLLVEKRKSESVTHKDYNRAEPETTEDDIDASPPEGELGEKPAWAVDLNAWKLGKPVVQKPDGTTIYMVRDIAGAIQRYEEYKFDKMIYVIGDQQDLHVAQFFKILSLMEVPFASQLEHVNFGRVNGMSTRNGEVKFLDQILDTAKEAMLDQMNKNQEKMSQIEDPDRTADEIGITCVKIQDMSAKRIISYDFDWQRMTSFEGDTGAYLQYQHVRLCSVARKVAPSVILRNDPTLIDTSLLTEPKAHELVMLLARYPDVVRTALKNSEPNTIASYCFKLSHIVSSAWEILIVKDQEIELAQARLLLFTCAKSVLSSAMRLLSLSPLEHM
ncbi:Arginine--tRNA ligase, cytoplasmic [Hypsizygus marmoreus]|uniref:arginine--tRNA ligase n=1 Tax=Hypsizygus marmoreus TaxID=39966 RepID=A0A369JGA5_HYPMA|nr:Arginine--tRNA ligase, cytoplasmic [Hypsizygus marmoreus]